MKRIFHVAAVIVLAAAQCVFAAEPAATPAPAFPVPDEVTGIEIGGAAGSLIELVKVDGEWTLPRRAGAPVDQAKARRVLEALLAGTPSPVPAGVALDAAGFAEGEGLRIALATATAAAGKGVATEFFLGLRPEGDFDSAYVKMPDSAVVLVDADLRGELGLWKNRPDELPEPSVWLADSVGFDPAEVVGLTATYPDHVISLTRAPGGDEWTLASPAPGGELSRDGVTRWIQDLSDFAFTDTAPMPGSDKSWTHSIVLAFADGSEIALRAAPSHAGGDALAAFAAYPVAFVLPDWRFALYFNRMDSLFPKAAPHFALADVQLLDVRQGNESVKITRKDGVWEPVALPYAAKAEQVERLARLLAAWRPEDYADADAKARPAAGAMGRSVVEVVLANGGVHQYRLSGRHPVFPWRYVALDGARTLSVTDAEAGVMFPGFADILELGTVFAGAEEGAVSAFAAEDGGGKFSLRFTRDDAGAWTVENAAARSMPLETAEAEALAADLRKWRVTGFSQPAHAGAAETPEYRVTVGTDVGERAVALFPPAGRDVPYAVDSGDGEAYFLTDRAALHAWLVVMKEIARRADEYVPPVVEAPARTIVPAEVDFSGSVAEKAAAATASGQ